MAYQKPMKGSPRKADGLQRSAAFFSDLIDVVSAHKAGIRPPNQRQSFEGRGNNVVFIHNNTGADLQLGEAVKLGDYLLEAGHPYDFWFEGESIDATFSRRYAVAAEPIPDGAIGAAYVNGMCAVRYVGTAPSEGDWLGPKPGSATLENGYPGFASVDRVIDNSEKLALCTIERIQRILCKTGGTDVAAGTTSATNYDIYQGTAGSEASAAFTTLPSIYYRTAIGANKFFFGSWANGKKYAEPQEC